MKGKNVIVTGANSGIGYEAALAFARDGASVALVCRSKERGEQARDNIVAETGNDNVRLFLADFSSLKSISRVAEELRAAYPEIHVLCNNAGAANFRREITVDGFEKTFAVNHLAGFLLTRKLMTCLQAAAEQDHARIVFTSSYGHTHSPLDFSDLNLNRGYSTLKAYGRSKLANLLTARAIHKRYGAQGIVASSFHPGAVRTPIWKKGGLVASLLGFVMYPFMIDVKEGADTFIWLASSDDPEARNAAGRYFFKRHTPKTAPFATDDAADRLWEVSKEMVRAYL